MLVLLAVASARSTAQTTLGGGPPGPLIYQTGASVSITNSTALNTIFSYTVPAGLAQGNFAPLHAHSAGIISTPANSAQVGAVNVACNYGGATASISITNNTILTPATVAIPGGLSSTPIWLDVWVTGFAAPQANGIVEAITGMMYFASRSITSDAIWASASQAGTTAVTTANTLTCTWAWSSASASNSVIFHNTTLSGGTP